MDPVAWFEVPATVLLIAAAVLLLLALVQGMACRRHWQYRRRIRSTWHLLMFLALAALTLVLAGAGYTLRGYQLLAGEEPVLDIHALQLGPQHWQLELTGVDGRPRTVEIAGDAWRAEAVVLKWKLPGVLAGLPAVYRLDRLDGRYADAAQAAQVAPSVIAFDSAGEHDLFRLALAHQEWLPMVDTIYGSGAWMPLRDGADYQLSLMRTGALVARRSEAGNVR